MNKTQELFQLLDQNPNRELIYMYPSDEGSDHSFTLGKPSKILIDEYVVIGDRVWLRNEDSDELFDHLADNIAGEYSGYPLTDEQNAEIDKKVEIELKELNWKEAIIVYIKAS